MLPNQIRTACLSMMLIAGCCSSAVAGGLYLNEFVTPSMGTAGAGAEAFADDAATNFALHNPAGMTRVDGTEISMGAGALVADVKFDRDPNTPIAGGNSGNAGDWAPLLGSHFVHGITDELKFGMSLYSVAGASLKYDGDWAGRYLNTEIELLSVTFNPNLAYRLTDWLSISAGFGVTYAELDFKLRAPPPDGTGRVKLDGDDFELNYNAGVLVELSPQTRVGVIYVSEQNFDFDGNLKVKPAGISVGSETQLTLAQLVRVGAYHELNDEWALLGTVGWEDWSEMSDIFVSVERGDQSIPRDWRDTYHFSGGVHYRPWDDWLFQAGITYDTSPVSDRDRTPDMPIDRQIRYAIGAQYDWSDRLAIGGSFVYADMGDAKIDNSSLLRGDYDDNRIFFLALNMRYTF